MNQPQPRPADADPTAEPPDIERDLPSPTDPADIERPTAPDWSERTAVPEEERAAPVEQVETYAYAPARRTVTMGRGAFLAMVSLGVLAILALGAATAWLAFDRRGEEDPVVATVNGDAIHRSEYDRAVAQSNGGEVLDNLVLEYLISNEARKRNISVDAAETTKLLDEQKQQFGSDAAFQAALDQAGLTEQDLTKQLRLSAMLRQMVADKTQVTDDEVNQTFTANAAQFANQPEAEAKAQIRSNLQRQKESTAARDFIEQLRADAKIETKLPGKQS